MSSTSRRKKSLSEFSTYVKSGPGLPQGRQLPPERSQSRISREPSTSREVSSRSKLNSKADVEIRSASDLNRFRNLLSCMEPNKKADSVLNSLMKMIERIPIGSYSSSDASTKSSILDQMISAYNFAWNEACLQMKELSEEHAIVFAKLKAFYIELLDQYPKVLLQYENTVQELKQSSKNKDQEISAITHDLEDLRSKHESTRDLISGLNNKISHQKERKRYFKSQLNAKVAQIEDQQSIITDLRCQILQRREQSQPIEKVEPPIKQTAPNTEKVDISVQTDQIAQTIATVTVDEAQLPISQIPSEDEIPIEGDNAEGSVSAALRRVAFSFMLIEPPDSSPMTQFNTRSELRKFFWVYPKVLSIFLNGISREDPLHRFACFEDVVRTSISQYYQTSFLLQQALDNLLRSADAFEASDGALHLFNRFAKGEFDISQFRFFNTVLEYSLCHATPDLSKLVSNDLLSPTDTQVNISSSDAMKVFTAIFPFLQPRADQFATDPCPYWDFLSYLIEDFSECRKHLWETIQHAFLLCECSDLTHITYHQFSLFLGIVFPQISKKEFKPLWSSLIVRRSANGFEGDDIDGESIFYLCTSRGSLIDDIMQIRSATNFTKMYYEFNSSMLEVVRFVIQRLTLQIPSMIANIPGRKLLLRDVSRSIRASLFICDLSNALAHYRKLLHVIDGTEAENFSNLRVTNELTSDAVKELLEHFEMREKVVGIESIEK